MDIQTLGNLAEVIGSLAVLVTLIYLSIQTKQTVTNARQSSHSDILTRRQELMILLMERDLIEVWSKGCSRQQMDSIDAQRFTSFAVSFLSHVQDTYIQFKAGLVDEGASNHHTSVFTKGRPWPRAEKSGAEICTQLIAASW